MIFYIALYERKYATCIVNHFSDVRQIVLSFVEDIKRRMLLHRQLRRSVSRHQTVDPNSTATDMKRMLRDPFISIPIVMNIVRWT